MVGEATKLIYSVSQKRGLLETKTLTLTELSNPTNGWTFCPDCSAERNADPH